jgi:hypothetical protein
VRLRGTTIPQFRIACEERNDEGRVTRAIQRPAVET